MSESAGVRGRSSKGFAGKSCVILPGTWREVLRLGSSTNEGSPLTSCSKVASDFSCDEMSLIPSQPALDSNLF